MKFAIASSFFATALMAGSAMAHSWLECVDTVVPNYADSMGNPAIDPIQTCKGYPRNKIYQDQWISESSYYMWDLNGPDNSQGLACRPLQGTPTYPAKQPMTTARPGDALRMRFWGNGHTRWDIGSPNHRDPGLVRVYWAGAKEIELTHKDNLTETNWFPGAQGNFSADAITQITNGKMNEKANYYTLNIPQNIEPGRHMMVWTWAWSFGLEVNKAGYKAGDYNREWANSYSTCFDIEIVDSTYDGATFDNSGEDDSSDDTICSTGSGLKGGMPAYPCTGAECPPCWYKTATTINCFDYDPATGKCPFGGAFDCKLGKQTRRALKHERAPFV